MRNVAVVTLLALLQRLTHVFGVQRTLRMAERCAPLLRAVFWLTATRLEPQACADWIDAADRRFTMVPGRCLPRSLLLCTVLRAGHYTPELKLGVRTLTGAFEAHAWVELHGQVLNDSADVAMLYAPFSLTGRLPT